MNVIIQNLTACPVSVPNKGGDDIRLAPGTTEVDAEVWEKAKDNPAIHIWTSGPKPVLPRGRPT